MDNQLEEDMEHLEDENQCLKDELEVAVKELEVKSQEREEIEKLLAYFIFQEDPNNRGYIQSRRGFNQQHRMPEPYEMAKLMGYHARPGDGDPFDTVKYAVPMQQPMSFRGGGGFPVIAQMTHRTIEIPNLRLEKR